MFTRAVGQIGDPSLDIRIGGLYGLQRIGLDSAKDVPAIQEILSAFIRQHAAHAHAPKNPPDGARPDASGLDKRACAWHVETSPLLRIRAADVQAAITILTEHPRTSACPPLQLSYVDLHRGDLRDAHLAEADLHYGDLSANLTNADLHLADLTGTRLLGQA